MNAVLVCASCGYRVAELHLEDLPALVRGHLLNDCPCRFEAGVFEREPRWSKRRSAADGAVTYEIAWTDSGWGQGRVALEATA